ncbi:hypothetical protein HBA54_03265 [Pelagibius litoralis]|uniref:Uncharacterized protein n=1 Tax=Pelagibius litoralis TaxID=374515 RepID=A0A967C6R2_9PROT|nr:hypothetical protein [Pelagibius litoralis]NIA67602.1 hypothetical protein [Pelagibius litoralis]
MAAILQFPKPGVEFDIDVAPFGWCTFCRRPDTRYVNVGKIHFGFCQRHEIYWLIGEDIFKTWEDQDETHWEFNRRILQGYSFVGSFRVVGVPAMMEKAFQEPERSHR